MLAQQQYQKYQQNSVMTASPAKLTLMLYNGAIRFCDQSVEALDLKDIKAAHTNIIKAQNIISELQVTLKDDYAVSKQIRSLYDYIMYLLVQGNIRKDKDKILEARKFIVQFRDMWQEVMKLAR